MLLISFLQLDSPPLWTYSIFIHHVGIDGFFSSLQSFALTKCATVRALVYMLFVFLPVCLWDTLCFFQCTYRIVSCWMWKWNGKCIFFSVLPSLRGKGRSWELVRGLGSIQVRENSTGWGWGGGDGVGRGLRVLESARLLNRFWT